MTTESLYERSCRMAKADHPEGNEDQIKRAAKHYFAHFFKMRNGIKSIARINGKLTLVK